MPFNVKSKKSGETYYLHSKEVTLKGGRKQRLFFFSKEVKQGAMDALPEGYTTMENARTGLPMLKKKA
jgi:YHS domain-containing protein